jgi:hypothetical protein
MRVEQASTTAANLRASCGALLIAQKLLTPWAVERGVDLTKAVPAHPAPRRLEEAAAAETTTQPATTIETAEVGGGGDGRAADAGAADSAAPASDGAAAEGASGSSRRSVGFKVEGSEGDTSSAHVAEGGAESRRTAAGHMSSIDKARASTADLNSRTSVFMREGDSGGGGSRLTRRALDDDDDAAGMTYVPM